MGLAARRYMERGQLVPDDITVKMLLERLDQPDARPGVILDGFPRNRAQALVLDDALADRGSAVDQAVAIEVPVDDLVRRIGKGDATLLFAAADTEHNNAVVLRDVLVDGKHP